MSVTKFISGNKFVTASVEETQESLILSFMYSPSLLSEVKAMTDAKWNPDLKVWTVKNCVRNKTAIAYLEGKQPFGFLNRKPAPQEYTRPVAPHQKKMIEGALGKRRFLIAGDPGVGKTLAAIEIMERTGVNNIWYVCPKRPIPNMRLEFRKWGLQKQPTLMSYEELVKRMKSWRSGDPAPDAVIFDECSRLKTWSTQRTQAANHLVTAMREEHPDPVIILMSGTPAPKDPTDWWSQIELLVPGFIKEGDIHKFKRRLCIITKEENLNTGLTFPKIKTWYDDPRKCKVCGEFKELHFAADHSFEPSIDEITNLGKRLEPIVCRVEKSEATGLPEKQYEIIPVEPTPELLRLQDLILNTETSPAQALIKLRELSDGFQYIDSVDGEETCPLCEGVGETKDIVTLQMITCPKCGGKKVVPKIVRSITSIRTAKDKAFVELLEDYRDYYRFVAFAGFQASVDKVSALCAKEGWDVIQLDGRGWKFFNTTNNEDLTTPEQMLETFADRKNARPIVFVAHPKSGGMSFTLTAACASCYYSNDFDGEARMQSEDRIHRLGMDANKGAKIYDLLHLDADFLVYENVKKKIHIQGVTMSAIREAAEVRRALSQ